MSARRSVNQCGDCPLPLTDGYRQVSEAVETDTPCHSWIDYCVIGTC